MCSLDFQIFFEFLALMVGIVTNIGTNLAQTSHVNLCGAWRAEVVTVYDVGAGMITTYVDYGMKISIVVM